jgi:hypothetical protein
MEPNVSLCAFDGDLLSNPTCYRHLVGSLVHLAVTRPDISYHVHILSLFVFAPLQSSYAIYVGRSLFVSSFLVLAPFLLRCNVGE